MKKVSSAKLSVRELMFVVWLKQGKVKVNQKPQVSRDRNKVCNFLPPKMLSLFTFFSYCKQ